MIAARSTKYFFRNLHTIHVQYIQYYIYMILNIIYIYYNVYIYICFIILFIIFKYIYNHIYILCLFLQPFSRKMWVPPVGLGQTVAASNAGILPDGATFPFSLYLTK